MAQSKLMTQAMWKIVYYLVDEGIKIIENARYSKTTDNISGTQYDSYGLAVFYNGRIYYSAKVSDPSKDLSRATRVLESYNDLQYFDKDGKVIPGGKHKGWGDIPAGTGRDWAQMFVNEIKRSSQIPDKGFVLVIFNAAFYSSIQETKQNYRILSQVVGDIKELGGKFNGSKLRGINISIG